MVVPAVLLTVRQYHRRNHIDFRRAALGAISSIIFTWLGARLALGMDAILLRRIYSVFVMAIALYYFDQSLSFSRRRRRSDKQRPGPRVVWPALVYRRRHDGGLGRGRVWCRRRSTGGALSHQPYGL